ncbi:hypothetical protein CARUB_v10020886mg [Capsella rubella]|uniref:non-specific serine/threonine protein kinase n=1 Tax=Capsella rubella TaxID=81985 RepID=R0GIE7_9BRAS|nr:hypothetical protein CARUB_v10020886mg [Capsella rubella]
MNYHPISCLLFFFQSLPCASSKQELGLCDTLFQCGNITAGFPFWGGNRHKDCGHPLLELHCDNNINKNTSLFISEEEYSVFQLDQKSNTLKLAKTKLLSSFCSSVTSETSFPTDIFELLPTYNHLPVSYLCISSTHNLSTHTCPQMGSNSAFNVTVPTSFVTKEKELNMTNLKQVLQKGFEVKLKIDENACQDCVSSHGICSFGETFPYEFNKCIPLHPLHQPTGWIVRREEL